MQKLYRGYVATKNKKCLQKFKDVPDNQLLDKETAEKFDEYAGILAPNIVLIDIDHMEQSEKMLDIVEDMVLDCHAVYTTRGAHFYFANNGRIKKCATGVKLACGLTADIKIGDKNSYAILKYNGKTRRNAYEIEPETPLMTVPDFLLPVDTDVDFWQMTEGDGRNQKLFNHILTLNRAGLEKDKTRETLKIMNKYILAEPLPETELDTISRDEAFPDEEDEEQFYNKKGAFLFDKFSNFLMRKHKIIRLNNVLHIYENGIYVQGYDKIERAMIEHVPNLNRQKRAEVISYLNLLIKKNSRAADAEFIAFKNGIYNIETGDFTGFTPDLVITNKIDYDYNPEAYSEIADKTLNKLACGNTQIRQLLDEVIGYTFYRRNELRKAFILTGDKHNGKSTYLDMIATLLGEENTSALDLKELGDRFKTAELFGKLANIGDDIGDEFIANPAIFKKVVSGDKINVERKGQDPFDFHSYAKQLFSANSIPRIKDKSGAVIDRLVIIPFEASFTKSDPDYDPYIKYKLRDDEVMEYLIQIGIAGLIRVLDNQSFTISESVEKNIKEYEISNNPILMFFEETEEDDIIDQRTATVYQNYISFCLSNNFQQMSNIEFSKQIKKHYNCTIIVTTRGGKNVRVFRKL